MKMILWTTRWQHAVALFCCVLLVSSTAVAAADVMYVRVAKTQVRAGKTSSSAVVAEVPQGTRLTLKTKTGVRYAVQLDDGRQGYVSRLHLTDKAPASGGLLSAVGGIKDDRSPTERRTAVSGRGLSEAAKKMASNESLSKDAVSSVEKMEALAASISDEQVNRFRREGGLVR
ncbi:MAG: hypothetical protein QGH15_13145 [Kiritimatiellia bacterium]|nr:hypothetical protein [Kiritimatiellia bacterium]